MQKILKVQPPRNHNGLSKSPAKPIEKEIVPRPNGHRYVTEGSPRGTIGIFCRFSKLNVFSFVPI